MPWTWSKVYKDTVYQNWSGGTRVACSEPCPQPHRPLLEWTGTLTGRQNVLNSSDINDWTHYCFCGSMSTNSHSQNVVESLSKRVEIIISTVQWHFLTSIWLFRCPKSFDNLSYRREILVLLKCHIYLLLYFSKGYTTIKKVKNVTAFGPRFTGLTRPIVYHVVVRENTRYLLIITAEKSMKDCGFKPNLNWISFTWMG